uniref:MULE transposase domain-containing protein n=1 Tax=Cajanus cajan TaxID=3821 RepID=A0A151RV82_CAJCA|nr:hypothetical protein KK1_031918 [Cajanus cajan]KYP46468.1 hypothetical protein KK1_031924 [Cajanus cajan]
MILKGPHTCVSSPISQDHNKLGSQMISQTIREIIEANPSTPISTIIAHIKLTMGYTISYKKGWLTKQHAIENIFGNWEESYNKLPGMLQAMQMYVPGFIWKFNTQLAYQGYFWTFKPIDGFAFCKPIVQVDGTFLYNKYKGMLLVAVAQDDCNNIIPIAFAVLAMHGFFFLKNLRRYVTLQDRLCLISDLHEAIRSAYSRNRSGWTENNFICVYCIRHFAQNFMRRFKNAALKKDVVNMPYGMTDPRFFYYYNIVRDTNAEVAQWLDNIPRENFQKVYIPCSHVLASCLHARHNYQTYISPIYTLQQVAKVYEGQFGEL